MPRTITVTFGDGTTHAYQNAPDNITPEQVSARAEQEFGKKVTGLDGGKAPAEEGFLESAGRVVKNVGTGLAKGFTGLATLAGDAMADDPQIRYGVMKAGGVQPQVGDVSKMVAQMGYQPRDTKERIVQALSAGVGGGLSGPGAISAPIKAAAIGGSAAMGSEVANEASGGNKALSLLGGVLGGGVAGVAANLKGNTQALAREALKDVKPQDLDAAKKVMIDAQTSGIPLNLSQSMPNPSNIDTIVSALANSRYGTKVTKQLRDQPGQVAFGVEDQMAHLPGQIRAPQVVANNMQEVATQVINNARKDRSDAWKTTFDTALGQIKANANTDLNAAVKQASEIADRLARVQAGESRLNSQIAASAQGQHERALLEHQQQVATIRQRNEAAMAAHEKRMADYNAGVELPATPTGTGSEGVTKRLFDLPEVGDASLGKIDAMGVRNEVVPGLTQGKGQIQLEDGSLAASKFGPPQAPKLENYPPVPELNIPGFPESAPAIAGELRAANKTVAGAKQAVQTVGELPQSAVSGVYKKLTALADERPNTGLAESLIELRNRLIKSDEEGFVTNASQLNEILKDATARLKSPNLTTQGIDAGAAKFMGQTIDGLRKDLGDKFAPFRDANAQYAKLTDEVVNPLKKSVVGDIAGRRGALPDVEAVKNKLTTVFDAGTVPGAKSSEILTLEKAVRKIPESESSVSGAAAYQDAVKSWMAQRVSAASKQQGGRVDPQVAAHLEQAFIGNDTKAQGFKDILVGLARSQGKPDDTYVQGMTNFLRIASMAGRRPGVVQGVSQSGAAEIAGRTIANAGGSTTINPLRNAMLRWSERLQANAYQEMDRLLTSPEGVDMLRTLAKKPVMSPAAHAAVATFLGTNAAQADDPPPAYEQ